jgi:nitrate reductase gamma subunit
MAKRKRIAGGSHQPDVAGRSSAAQAPEDSAPSLFTPEKLLGFAAGLIAAAIIYAAYWPADSTEVQTGAARYLAGMLIIAGGITIGVRPLWNEPGVSRADKLIDIAAWGLAFSMVVSTGINADGSNLRLGINEMWWWVAAAALLSAGRRICLNPNVPTVFFHLIIAVTLAVAVFGWHQQLIGIPAMIEMYESDPDAMLRAAGIQADEGSGLRIVFHNRLYDGGPTGTFALANSMAALLVGGLVVMLGLSIQRWTTMTAGQKAGWVVAIVIVGGMLLASRSRSAAGSLLIVAVITLTRRWWDGRILTIAKISAAAGGVIAILVAIAWRFGRNTEWIGQAPASLEVRWRYWIASIKMVAQSPLFGVGPGQFKARYEMYRADASTEQIADPHNWFWQIATTGGLVAAIIALILVAAIVWRLRERATIGNASIEFQPSVLYSGAGVAVGLIWIGGTIVGYLPTVDAAMLATIAGVAMLWLAIRSEHNPIESETAGYMISPQRIAGYAVLAMAIDLMAAGGLIVPGVAIPLWVLIAIACTQTVPQSTDNDTVASPVATIDRTRVVIGGAVTLILVAWYMTAILPIEQARAGKGRFEVAWEQGRAGEAESALRQAAAADRWDAEPMLQLAAVLSQAAVADSQNRGRRQTELQQVQAEAIDRVGNDPVAFRQLGDGQLRLFQRYGDIGALRSAESLFSRATSLAPAHEAYAAQLAEIYRQLGDEQAEVWAERAVTLSAAGGYYERSLPFVLVMPAQFIGESVVQGEVRRPASEVLPTILQPQRQQPGTAN